MSRFNICQFFNNDTYEYVRQNVSASEAVEVFKNYTTNPAAIIGTTVRVIITDSNDYTCADWKFGEGLVYPIQQIQLKDNWNTFQVYPTTKQND